MQGLDLSKPGEKKKLIWAAGLGLVAIVFLYWVLIGFESSTPTTVRTTPSPSPQQRAAAPNTRTGGTATPEVDSLTVFTEILYEPSSYNASQENR